MKNRDLKSMLSLILALTSAGICLTFWGLVSGFEKGYFYGVFYNPPPTGFSADGPNFFEVINTWYFIIAAGYCGYLVGKFLMPISVSTLVCVLSLSIALYPFWDMYFYKREVLGIDFPFSYDYWLWISTYFDWFLCLAAIVLLIMQVFSIVLSKADVERFEMN